MFVFMLLLLLPFTISKAKDFPANPIEKAGYKLDFSDEFNGPTLDRENGLIIIYHIGARILKVLRLIIVLKMDHLLNI